MSDSNEGITIYHMQFVTKEDEILFDYYAHSVPNLKVGDIISLYIDKAAILYGYKELSNRDYFIKKIEYSFEMYSKYTKVFVIYTVERANND
jgi:hypothetical protein